MAHGVSRWRLTSSLTLFMLVFCMCSVILVANECSSTQRHIGKTPYGCDENAISLIELFAAYFVCVAAKKAEHQCEGST